MSSKKTRVFKSRIAIFYYKNLCIKIYLSVLDKFKLLHMKCLISVTVNYFEQFFALKTNKKKPLSILKMKISSSEVLKDSVLRWTGLKPFVIYLNVYFWERCYLANDLINNFKLTYKFMDTYQKILKERERSNHPLFVQVLTLQNILQIKKSVSVKADPMLIGE